MRNQELLKAREHNPIQTDSIKRQSYQDCALTS
jgi:hypothetical protein